MYVCPSISHRLRLMAEGYDIMSLKDSRSFIKPPAEVGGDTNGQNYKINGSL